MGPGSTGDVLGAFVGLTLAVLTLNTILIYNFLPHHRGLRELLQGNSLDFSPSVDSPSAVAGHTMSFSTASASSSPLYDVIWVSTETNSVFKRRTNSYSWEEWVGNELTYRFEQPSPELVLIDESRNFAMHIVKKEQAYYRFGDTAEWSLLGKGYFEKGVILKDVYKEAKWSSDKAGSKKSVFYHPAGSESWYEMQGVERKFEFELVSWEGRDGGSVVTLVDPSRNNISVQLNEFSAKYHYSNSEEWVSLSQGQWSVVEGKQIIEAQQGTPPKPVFSTANFSTAKIFVGLAAFREGLCGNTLKELFHFAKYPERVFAGVIQQNAQDDPDCLEDYCQSVKDCRRSQVKIITVPLSHSRQVMPARYRQHLLLDKQDFCLQVDSHSAFEQDWDLIALQTWLDTGNEMAVLTAYPNTVGSRHDQSLTPNRCSTQFSGSGLDRIVHGGNSAMNLPPGNTPNRIPFFGAGIGFARCHASLNVPYDPYMPFLMGGEEFNTAARLWTWGYDLYAPSKNFVYHYYNDEHLPPELAAKRKRQKSSYTTPDPSAETVLQPETIKRWRALFGLPLSSPPLAHTLDDLEVYGLGRRRTLDAYLEFAGVNLLTGKLTSRCDELGHLRWHPYTFEEPFLPSGPECNDPHTCCNSFVRGRKSAEIMLNKTATQLREEAVSLQDTDVENWSRSRPPVLAKFATSSCFT